MRYYCLALASLTACLSSSRLLGEQVRPLCVVATGVEAGAHHAASVTGILAGGRETSFLYDPKCQNGAPMTWVDFTEKASSTNRSKLEHLLKKSGRALVELDGEIWGPRIPDPNAPETVRRLSPTGWGHLSAYKTRFIVRSIRKATPVAADVPQFRWPQTTEQPTPPTQPQP